MSNVIRPKPKDENQLTPVNTPTNNGNNPKPQQNLNGNNDLERLLLDGARGYQEHLQALLGNYISNEKDLENPQTLVPLYLLIHISPNIDYGYSPVRKVQEIKGVTTINKGFLPYLLGFSEEEINGMSNKEISELVSSLPEASLDIELTSPTLSAPILALSTEPLGRPVIGAAAYLAKKDDVNLPIFYLHLSDNYFSVLGKLEISTYYIKRVKEEYDVPQEMYLAALRSIKKAKEIYNERWSS